MDEWTDTGGEWDLSSQAASNGSLSLTAFLCGALTGLSIGVLLAPAPGAEVRRRIGSIGRRFDRRVRRHAGRDKAQTPSVAAFVDRTRMPDAGESANTSR
jgi:hypothetical protein